MPITNAELKQFRLKNEIEIDAGELCEECGEELPDDGICPVCSPEKDDGQGFNNEELE